MPPLLSRTDFLAYIKAFNTRDYTFQHSFYSPSITMILPDPAIPPLLGPAAISQHYAQVHSVARETVVPITVLNDNDKVFFVMEVYFQYLMDTDEGVHGKKVKEGDVFSVTVWALYDLDERGKMVRIRCNLWEERMLGKVEVGPLIEESRGRAQEDLR